jgi:hypothetical protein
MWMMGERSIQPCLAYSKPWGVTGPWGGSMARLPPRRPALRVEMLDPERVFG